MSKSVTVETGSEIIGKSVGLVEKKFNIEIKQLENFDDRILPFPMEKLPRNRKIKEGDMLTVNGEKFSLQIFCQTASLN
jgi:uncharacterized protein with PhoU and TrkA domain